MPAAVTIQLQAPTPLFFDQGWPLEEVFLGILKRAEARPPALERREDAPKPYALSLLRPADEGRVYAPEAFGPTTYRWRVCLLDDAWLPFLLQGLEATQSLTLDENSLTVGEVAVEMQTYPQIAERAQASAQARPKRARRLGLEFVTPVILYRSGVPLPLPDPVLVFRHYLSVWDTFAPRHLQVNFNLLDAVQFHVALTEHRLATQRVRVGEKRSAVGFLGSAVYFVRRWQKLGEEFLGHLQMLVRFAPFCGTGVLTTRGLGQTRRLRGRVKKR